MKVQEITFVQFPLRNQICSMSFMGFSPAVFKQQHSGYGIRISKGGSWSSNGSRSCSFDYFELDDTGLITDSPRGMAKQFNNKVRITDISAACDKYKEERINHV